MTRDERDLLWLSAAIGLGVPVAARALEPSERRGATVQAAKAASVSTLAGLPIFYSLQPRIGTVPTVAVTFVIGALIWRSFIR